MHQTETWQECWGRKVRIRVSDGHDGQRLTDFVTAVFAKALDGGDDARTPRVRGFAPGPRSLMLTWMTRGDGER